MLAYLSRDSVAKCTISHALLASADASRNLRDNIVSFMTTFHVHTPRRDKMHAHPAPCIVNVGSRKHVTVFIGLNWFS
eukprot:SAG31_NODE_21334_length_552_cov_0.796909_1_plen_77_part_01